MAALEDVKKAETLDSSTDDRSNAERIFDEFCADRESLANLGVTEDELRELSRASLLGTLTGKDDLLFILRQIRAAITPTAPDINQRAETMRMAALAKLDELDLEAAAWRRSARGRIESASARVTSMLNRARSFAMHLWHKSGRRSLSSRMKPLRNELTTSS